MKSRKQKFQAKESEKNLFFSEEEEPTEEAEFCESKMEQEGRIPTRSSEEEHTKNALASGAEEGRDKLRKAAGRSKYP